MTVPDTELALVTGASSGIGLELARLFARDGTDLVLVARREDRLDALAAELAAAHGVAVHVLPQDLAAPGAAAAILEWLEHRELSVDVLVNNAGFGLNGPFLDLDLPRQLAMIQVNVTSLVALTGSLLPGMIARRRGGILNVGSIAGFQPGPLMATYYATKAFVVSFTEALHEEVRGRGVRITCLAPGPVATEFMDIAGMAETRIFSLAATRAVPVARAGYKAFRKGRPLSIPGFSNKVATLLVRISPRVLVRRVVKKLN
jgi:hypothetical protein